jgi:hypothetical protein
MLVASDPTGTQMPPVDQPTTPSPEPPTAAGSLDGRGAGDHDQPYRFGRRPTASVPYPFSTRQYARLLALRSRVEAGLAGADDLARAA